MKVTRLTDERTKAEPYLQASARRWWHRATALEEPLPVDLEFLPTPDRVEDIGTLEPNTTTS